MDDTDRNTGCASIINSNQFHMQAGLLFGKINADNDYLIIAGVHLDEWVISL